MRPYACQYCGSTVFFENTRCNSCHSELGYWAETDDVCVLDPVRSKRAVYTSWAMPGHELFRGQRDYHAMAIGVGAVEPATPSVTL